MIFTTIMESGGVVVAGTSHVTFESLTFVDCNPSVPWLSISDASEVQLTRMTIHLSNEAACPTLPVIVPSAHESSAGGAVSPTSSTTHASPSQLGARGWKSAATAASLHAGSTQSSRGGRAAAAIGRGMQ